jgi:hypothetical protein
LTKINQDSRGRGFKASSEKQKKYSKKGTQILLAGDLDLIEKGESGTLTKDVAEIERMLKSLIIFLKIKPLNPWALFYNQIGEESKGLTTYGQQR